MSSIASREGASTLDEMVVRIEARTCVFPLPGPFLLGRRRIEHREYVVVTVTDSSGVKGNAFGLSRGAPIESIVTAMLGPLFIGSNIADPGAVSIDVGERLQPHATEGLVGRAMSLIDIALWDILGQHLRQPVGELLGARRRSAPAMVVEGYPKAAEDDAMFVDRLLGRVDEGYKFLKVAWGATDPGAFTDRLSLLMRHLPQGVAVAVDAAWGWQDEKVASRQLKDWALFDLAWIEDPVPADDLKALRRMREGSGLRFGVGDEVARVRTLLEVATSGTVDVLRVDVTCAGGFSRFAEIAATAEKSNLMVSTHVYPELHVHAALGATHEGPVEFFPPKSPWDTAWEFVSPVEPTMQAGIRVFESPTSVGLGLQLDWSRIEATTATSSFCEKKGRT